ncbi:MAG: PIN domain-containing protein [Muribaculaceae bacterium]|nr:PIN domain-containing protein [Muribaculaceae bacterium]
MKKVFLDTNFIMDLLVRGPKYSIEAKKVLDEGTIKDYHFYVSFLSIANFAYINRKVEKNRLRENIELICDLFHVIPNDKSNLIQAWDYEPQDYEDAIQYSCALSNKCDCIITRNKQDFYFSQIPIFTPEEFINSEFTTEHT